jgi:hypothetical protein
MEQFNATQLAKIQKQIDTNVAEIQSIENKKALLLLEIKAAEAKATATEAKATVDFCTSLKDDVEVLAAEKKVREAQTELLLARQRLDAKRLAESAQALEIKKNEELAQALEFKKKEELAELATLSGKVARMNQETKRMGTGVLPFSFGKSNIQGSDIAMLTEHQKKIAQMALDYKRRADEFMLQQSAHTQATLKEQADATFNEFTQKKQWQLGTLSPLVPQPMPCTPPLPSVSTEPTVRYTTSEDICQELIRKGKLKP